MGMFDYIVCEAELPDVPVSLEGVQFQTKDTPDQYLTVYTITKDGRLSWRPYEMVEVPKHERTYPDAPENDFRSLIGSMRREERELEFINYDGSLEFVAAIDTHWLVFRAQFTKGSLEKIEVLEFEEVEDE